MRTHFGKQILLATATILLGWSAGSAAEVKLTVDPGQVLHRIDPKIYGHFLEHIYHSCNGGLWGDLIWDRSFEGGGAGVAWTATDDVIAQEGAAADVRLTFGSPQWKDYEFTVEARKTGGDEGFLILLRALNKKQFFWANLGGWGNAGHALERGTKGDERWRPVTPRQGGRIETDLWYHIRARCEGPRIQVWLGEERVIDYTDDGKGAPRGQVGVGTWATQAQFRNFKVASLDGKILHEGLPPIPDNGSAVAPGWRVAGTAEVAATTENPLNGEKCRFIKTDTESGGLAQQPMRIVAGEVYRGSLWARGEATSGLSVQLLDGDRILAGQALAAPSAEWKEIPIELKAAGSSDEASLRITVPAGSGVWLDQVSLMPESWRNAGGFRPDLLEAIAGLNPPVIRWPGGCFASPYRWKDGIGPQHKRGPHPKSMWDDKEVNSFGTDEFIAMCRRVGAEPLIVINIGTKQWNADVQDNDFIREALDWIEYCNGPAESKWGKVRAAHGHPEPYGVKYWEIDNETWHMKAEDYAAEVNRFGPAMRKADPSIRLAACGSGGYNQDWNRTVINESGKSFDYLSTHHYESPDNFATGPAKDEAFYRELKTIIDQGPNPGIKIYCSEWNAQSTDWRTGLYCGGILNVFERCGDFFEIGGPALFLRHVSAGAWDNAFVNFDHRGWFPAPNYVVMKLWRDHFAPQRIEVKGEAGDLNIVATLSDDGREVFVKAVNPAAEAREVAVGLTGGFRPKSASFQLVAPGGLSARNSLEQPGAVRPMPGEVAIDGTAVRFELPAYSAGVVRVAASD